MTRRAWVSVTLGVLVVVAGSALLRQWMLSGGTFPDVGAARASTAAVQLLPQARDQWASFSGRSASPTLTVGTPIPVYWARDAGSGDLWQPMRGGVRYYLVPVLAGTQVSWVFRLRFEGGAAIPPDVSEPYEFEDVAVGTVRLRAALGTNADVAVLAGGPWLAVVGRSGSRDALVIMRGVPQGKWLMPLKYEVGTVYIGESARRLARSAF